MVALRITIPSYKLTYDKKETKKVMRQAGQEVARAARALIRASGGGRTYGHHTAGAPGSAPASLTGKLAASIHVTVKQKGFAIMAIVSDNARTKDNLPYNLFLEAGAYGGGRKATSGRRSHQKRTAAERKATASSARDMEPRPYLSAALESRENSLADRLKDAIFNDVKFEKIK